MTVSAIMKMIGFFTRVERTKTRASTIKNTCLHHEDITEHEETKNEHGGVGKWQAVIKEEEKKAMGEHRAKALKLTLSVMRV